MKRFDVVISGAGMVGLMSAIACAESGRSVLLLEKGPNSDWQPDQARSLRVSALSAQHMAWFEKLGLAKLWQASRVGHYKQMQVWDNRSHAEITFDSSHSEHEHLGAMVENDHLMWAAGQVLASTHQVTRQFQTTITACQNQDKSVQLTLSDGSEVKAGLLLSAEGARSEVRQMMGIETDEKSYQQKGLVAYIELENTTPQTAYQAFNPTGPVGLLPVSDGLFSIVWTLNDDAVDRWLQCDEATFERALKVHINRDLGIPKLVSKRVAFPLKQLQAFQYHQGRVVLLGDAAHVVHPLAGQGVNLGLADAMTLVECTSNVSLKDDVTLMRQLKKYQRRRRAAVSENMLMINGIHQLFGHQQAPLPWLRSVGMNAVNRMDFVKSWLMKQAGS